MLGSIWRFIKRNRRKFVFTGIVVGGVYVATKYLMLKMKQYEDNEAADLLDHARRRHHFDSIQRTCNMTVLSMLPNIKDALQKCLDTEKIISQLKSGVKDKVERWERLKIMSVTNALSALYASCVLVMLLRVKVNIIGGYIFLDNFSDDIHKVTEDTTVTTTSSSVQERYLNLIQYFITKGIPELCKNVETAVTSVIASKSLKQTYSIHNLQADLDSIRRELECDVSSDGSHEVTSPLTRLIFPAEAPDNDTHETASDEDRMYETLVKDTRDTIESADFHAVLQQCVSKGHSCLMDFLAESYQSQLSDAESPGLCQKEIPLAKLIPVINGLPHRMCNKEQNIFIQGILTLGPLKDFASNVYEAFSHRDAVVT